MTALPRKTRALLFLSEDIDAGKLKKKPSIQTRHQLLQQVPKNVILYVYIQVTKPCGGCGTYDSYLLGTKEEVMRHYYRATKSSKDGSTTCQILTQEITVHFLLSPDSTFSSFSHDCGRSQNVTKWLLLSP